MDGKKHHLQFDEIFPEKIVPGIFPLESGAARVLDQVPVFSGHRRCADTVDGMVIGGRLVGQPEFPVRNGCEVRLRPRR